MKKYAVILVGLVIFFGFWGCAKRPDRKMLEKAQQLESQEKFAEAIKQYEKIARKFPNDTLGAEALHRVGLIYTNQLQDYEKAVGTFERVAKSYANTRFGAQAQFMIGFIYNNYAPDTAKARKAYEAFLAKYPQHELASSVQWELKYLGKDINEIPELAKAIQGGEGKKASSSPKTTKKRAK